MSGISTKLRWRRVVNELRFLHDELKLVKEISTSTAVDFQEFYEKFCEKKNIDIGALNDKHRDKINEAYRTEDDPDLIVSDEELKEHLLDSIDTMIAKYKGEIPKKDEPIEPVDREIHESFNKLFKSIALKIHPDKAADEFTRVRYEKLFKEAKDALDNFRYFKLIELAEEFDIELPKNYNEQIRWMKKENKKILGDIEKYKMTYNYLFSEAESDEDKSNIIKNFIKQLFEIIVE
jgi:hypothetical protein